MKSSSQQGGWKIPEDLEAFLKSGKDLEFLDRKAKRRKMKLKRLEELQLGQIYVTSEETEFEDEDPNCYGGYYVVAAVSLVQEAWSLAPQNLLMWFPKYESFGQYDSNHYNALRFEETKWKTIMNNPVPYLNAKYEPSESPFATPITPWREADADFRPGPIPRSWK